MSKSEKIEAYFEADKTFKPAINRLREIILSTELIEDFKWNSPVYTINGKNVVGIGSFKNHFGVWFFNGALLKDKEGVLTNAQEGKTKALRQLRYTSFDNIDEKLLKEYLLEAIENQKAGREIKSAKPVKNVVVPEELKIAFSKNPELKSAFKNLTPGRQREYAEHIAGAKQETTRLKRLDKCEPMILEGIGLNDKYKNC